jgi:hypothetical protein
MPVRLPVCVVDDGREHRARDPLGGVDGVVGCHVADLAQDGERFRPGEDINPRSALWTRR